MKTQTIDSSAFPSGGLFLDYKKESSRSEAVSLPLDSSSLSREVFTWEYMTSHFPLVYMLQPDYFMVFRFGSPHTFVYQQNLRLELDGTCPVTFDFILKNTLKDDLLRLQRMDRIIGQFALECRLQPFDYICTTILRWESKAGLQRYFIRNSTVLYSDSRGIPYYGLMAYKDVTGLVSAIRARNADITFKPEKADLGEELNRRIRAAMPKAVSLTCREREIVECLKKGMSSKQIAAALHISKATVDTHRQNLLRKWDVPNTAALLHRTTGSESCP